MLARANQYGNDAKAWFSSRILQGNPASVNPRSAGAANGIVSTDSTSSELKFPLPPRELLANREALEPTLINRPIADPSKDNPIRALYRFYEHVVLDQDIELRNEIEYFWYCAEWSVRDIPDPKDPDPERYACVACMTALLCDSFNQRMKLLSVNRHLGAPFTEEEAERCKAQESDKEEQPAWAVNVPPLTTTLAIPRWNVDLRDWVPLSSFTDRFVQPAFAEKNILMSSSSRIYFV